MRISEVRDVMQRGEVYRVIRLLSLLFILVSLSNFAYALSCTTAYSPTRNLNMGSINPYNYTNIVIPVTMSITCSGGGGDDVTYVYTFNGGSSGNMNARRMVYNSTNYVNYSLCTDTSCTQQYGNGSSGTFAPTKSYNLGNNSRTDSWIIYFVVPVQPLSVPGTYNDTIGVSISVSW